MDNFKKFREKKETQEDIHRLRTWICKQPHLPEYIDEEWVLAFIGGTKSVEIAKQKLESFCTMRSKYPHFFTFPLRDPLDPKYKESCKGNGKMFFLPKPTPEGFRIMIGTGMDYDRFDSLRYNTRLIMLLETAAALWPDSKGLIFIFDSAGADSTVIAKLNISSTTFLVQYFQSAVPLKMKKTVICNSHPIFDRVMSIVKPYMKKKMLSRVTFTSKGIESVKKHVPLELLPRDCCAGGEAPSSDELNVEWEKILESRRDWFLKSSRLATDENLRPPDFLHTYGIDGTFKTLTVD